MTSQAPAPAPAVLKFSKSRLVSLLREASDLFQAVAPKLKILSTLSWEPEVAASFLAAGGTGLPTPTYAIDREEKKKAQEALVAFRPKLEGDHPALSWLRQTLDSLHKASQLLLEVESDAFYRLSSEIYGNSRSNSFFAQTTNLGLAQSISTRIAPYDLQELSDESVKLLSAEEVVKRLTERVEAREPKMALKVELTEKITAKIVAGASRVRVRKGARFSALEVESLWNHEIESHSLTAHNGALQENCAYLSSGGPRTTKTQEGLAVFFEIYGHKMSQARFGRLCDRILAVAQVEDGADFVQLYRWYRERSDDELEAFYNTQRIFRGAKLTGGAPFTKDIVYLEGLLGIYNFLRIAAKTQNYLLVESLIAGRIALEDVGIIAWLRAHGILAPPKYLPEWLRNWEALLSFFSFSAFLNNVQLSEMQDFFDSHTLARWDLSP